MVRPTVLGTRQGSVRHCRALIPKMFRVDDDDFSSYEFCRNAVGNVELAHSVLAAQLVA